jgi:hypothetical protein
MDRNAWLWGIRGLPETNASEHLEADDRTLTRLAKEGPPKAAPIKLRFLACLTMPEIARVLETSPATGERHRTCVRTWLYAELRDRDGTENPQKPF